MIKYSVIVPVYNMEKYIEECVNSILFENRDDIEVILINDGSTDNSLALMKKYEDRVVKIINKKNSGCMDSWIKGAEVAQGKYMCFVDSDDKISRDYFQKLDCYLDKQDIDMLLFNYIKFNKNTEIKIRINKLNYGFINKNDLFLIKNCYYSNQKIISLYRWDKVIKSDIIKKNIEKLTCRTSYFEDHPISLLNLIKSNKIQYIDEYLYYYRLRGSSISHKVNDKLFSDNNAIEKLTENILIENHVKQEEIYKMHLYFLFQYARWALKSNNKIDRKKISIRDIFKIREINQKLILFLYKFRLKKIFVFLNKINHKKTNEDLNSYFE